MIVLALSEARCGPYLLSGVAGMAGLVEDVAVYSALQRVIPPRLMGGALGVRRAGLLLSLGLGSPVVPSLATSGEPAPRWRAPSAADRDCQVRAQPERHAQDPCP